MPDSEFQYRRLPAIEKRITEINPEKDIRVRLLCRIIDKADEVIVVDDSSAKAEIITSDLDVNANVGDLVRVFTRVLPLEEGFELRAEIIQDMSKLDLDLYKKIKEYY
jgi:hypothetical protein